MKEYLDIVDKNGNPTGETVERTFAHANGIWLRNSHVWLLREKNGKVQILLQKRVMTKDSFPGCYDISSAGHIPAGDDYEISALRELKEELGIDAEADALINCGNRIIIWDDNFNGEPYHDRQISRIFAMWTDLDEDDFTLQPEEVDSVMWMDFYACMDGVRLNTFNHCIVMEELEMVEKAVKQLQK